MRSWYKMISGTATDVVWLEVASLAGVPVSVVVAIWMACLDRAADTSGTIHGLRCAPLDLFFGLPEGSTERVVCALQECGLILEDGTVTSWERIQRGRDLQENSPERSQSVLKKTKSSTERVREFRARKRAESEPVKHNETDETFHETSMKRDETFHETAETQVKQPETRSNHGLADSEIELKHNETDETHETGETHETHETHETNLPVSCTFQGEVGSPTETQVKQPETRMDKGFAGNETHETPYIERKKERKKEREEEKTYISSEVQQAAPHTSESDEKATGNSSKEIPAKLREYAAFAESYQQQIKATYGARAPKVTDALIRQAAETIDKIVRLDGIAFDELQATLEWASADEFWCDKVMSLASLRTKSKNGVTKLQNLLNSAQRKTLAKQPSHAERQVQAYRNVFQQIMGESCGSATNQAENDRNICASTEFSDLFGRIADSAMAQNA